MIGQSDAAIEQGVATPCSAIDCFREQGVNKKIPGRILPVLPGI